MSEDGTSTVCPYCDQPVEPDAPGVTYAVEIQKLPTMGGSMTYIDGMGAFFHPECSPDAAGYAQHPHPNTTD